MDQQFYVAKYLLSKGRTIREVATEVQLCTKTVRKWAKKASPDRAPRQENPVRQAALRRRRAVVTQLARKTKIITQTRRSPIIGKLSTRTFTRREFPSPHAIRNELRRRKVVVSTATVRRDLIHSGFSARRQRRGPILTEKHLIQRRSFCQIMATRKQKLLFCDEKLISTNDHTCGWEWLRAGETAASRPTEQGACRLLLWAVIGKDFRRLVILRNESITKERYKTQCLRPVLEALKIKSTEGYFFTQDNARPHCGSLEYLKRNKVQVLNEPWPALSPDLNPCEQLWQILAQRVSNRAPYGLDQLQQFVTEEFLNIPTEQINKLVGSFSRRCKKVIAMNGHTIKP